MINQKSITTLSKLLPRFNGATILTTLLVMISLTSCEFLERFKSTQPQEAVARVHNNYLYKDDIANIVSSGTSPEDRAILANSYIQNWIKQQLILHKAETNLDDEKKNVDQKLVEYRNSLITYIYETELIRQRLDTIVNNTEIEKYYQENHRNFELKDNIIKVLYLKVKRDAPKIKKVKEWYKSNSQKDRLLLEEYCYQYATDFHLDDETWLLFDDLLKKIPIKTYDKEAFLKNNRYIEIEDSIDLYLVNIKGMKIRESLSPLSFVRDDIRVLIINKRKLDLIRQMEKAIYQEALEKNEFEVYP